MSRMIHVEPDDGNGTVSELTMRADQRFRQRDSPIRAASHQFYPRAWINNSGRITEKRLP